MIKLVDKGFVKSRKDLKKIMDTYRAMDGAFHVRQVRSRVRGHIAYEVYKHYNTRKGDDAMIEIPRFSDSLLDDLPDDEIPTPVVEHKWKPNTGDAHRRARDKYDREKTVQVMVKLNRKTDANIIQALESATAKGMSRQGFLKQILHQALD